MMSINKLGSYVVLNPFYLYHTIIHVLYQRSSVQSTAATFSVDIVRKVTIVLSELLLRLSVTVVKHYSQLYRKVFDEYIFHVPHNTDI